MMSATEPMPDNPALPDDGAEGAGFSARTAPIDAFYRTA
jgi:hypothetical protein